MDPKDLPSVRVHSLSGSENSFNRSAAPLHTAEPPHFVLADDVAQELQRRYGRTDAASSPVAADSTPQTISSVRTVITPRSPVAADSKHQTTSSVRTVITPRPYSEPAVLVDNQGPSLASHNESINQIALALQAAILLVLSARLSMLLPLVFRVNAHHEARWVLLGVPYADRYMYIATTTTLSFFTNVALFKSTLQLRHYLLNVMQAGGGNTEVRSRVWTEATRATTDVISSSVASLSLDASPWFLNSTCLLTFTTSALLYVCIVVISVFGSAQSSSGAPAVMSSNAFNHDTVTNIVIGAVLVMLGHALLAQRVVDAVIRSTISGTCGMASLVIIAINKLVSGHVITYDWSSSTLAGLVVLCASCYVAAVVGAAHAVALLDVRYSIEWANRVVAEERRQHAEELMGLEERMKEKVSWRLHMYVMYMYTHEQRIYLDQYMNANVYSLTRC